MIRKVLGLSMMAGVVSIFAFACGDDDEGPRYPTADSFCDAKATLECDKASVACGVAADACKTKRKSVCLAEGNTASGQGRSYTSAQAEGCLNLIAATFTTPDKTHVDAYDLACGHVFAGVKQKSEACTNQYDCAGTLYCDLGKTPSRCADKSAPKANGDGCANAGDICGAGLYCAPGTAADPATCRQRGGIGVTCTATTPCVETAYCNGTQCVALLAAGGACQTDDQCTTGFCNTVSHTCAGRRFPTTPTSDCPDFTN